MNYFPVGNVSELKTTFLGFDKKLKGLIIENVDRFSPSMKRYGFVVCNGELYGVANVLYKMTAYGWTVVPNSSLPYSLIYGNSSTVVLNGEIHILTGTKHHKWDGTQWVSISTLPYDFRNGGVIVYNDEIYIVGGAYANNSNTSRNSVYKFNGITWSQLTNSPISNTDFNLVVYNGRIYMLGGRYGSGSTTVYKYTYSFDGTTWRRETDMPAVRFSSLATVFNGRIHVFGGINTSGSSSSSYYTNTHWSYDGITWTDEGYVNIDNYSYLYEGTALVYGERLRIFDKTSAVLVGDKWYYFPYINDSTENGNGGNIIIPIFKD